MTNSKGKKVTIATIKAFIKREQNNLYINNKTSFDGMVDCVMPSSNPGFRKATILQTNPEVEHSTDRDNRLGVGGAWFVGSSRDYFRPYADDSFIGYTVSNCCGSFILAMPRR